MKESTLIDKFNAIQKIGTEVNVPYEVWTVLGNKQMSIMGNEISMSDNGDYSSLEKCKNAVEFYVNQLGGKVTWPK